MRAWWSGRHGNGRSIMIIVGRAGVQARTGAGAQQLVHYPLGSEVAGACAAAAYKGEINISVLPFLLLKKLASRGHRLGL